MEEETSLARWLPLREAPSPLALVAEQEVRDNPLVEPDEENVSSTEGHVVWEKDEMTAARQTECAARLAQSVNEKKNVNEFWKQKYIHTSRRAWDMFFRTHSDRFFKERHWLERDFPFLLAAKSRPLLLCEIGCGTGAAFLPLMERLPHLHVAAFDLSERAAAMIQQHPLYLSSGRAVAFAADAVQVTDIPAAVRAAIAAASASAATAATAATPSTEATAATAVKQGSALQRLMSSRPLQISHLFDCTLLLYMLSALPHEHHQQVIDKAAATLAPGGYLFLRDYGLYDEAQLRFSPSSRIEHNLFVRQDGTLAYFFSVEELCLLAVRAGLVVERCEYLCRKYVNRKSNMELRRVWVHAVFKKPAVPLFG
jgi:methyltransferase-like protein 6